MAWASSPTTVRFLPPGQSICRISACSRLVSWYSSTSTQSKRLRMERAARGVGQQPVPEEQQVVVVEDALLALVVDVGGEEAAEVLDLVLAPGEVGLDRFVHRLAGVDAAAVDVHAGALEREAAVALGQARARCGARP